MFPTGGAKLFGEKRERRLFTMLLAEYCNHAVKDYFPFSAHQTHSSTENSYFKWHTHSLLIRNVARLLATACILIYKRKRRNQLIRRTRLYFSLLVITQS